MVNLSSLKFWVNSKGLLGREDSVYVLPECSTVQYLESAGISEGCIEEKIKRKIN